MLLAAPLFISGFGMALYTERPSAGYFGGGIVDAKVDESPIRFWVAAMFHLSLGVTLIIVGLHGPS